MIHLERNLCICLNECQDMILSNELEKADVYYRTLMQDTRVVLDRVLCTLPGPLHVLHQPLQHLHENFLHRLDCLHYLFNEIQKAILHSKSIAGITSEYRLMTLLVTTSLI